MAHLFNLILLILKKVDGVVNNYTSIYLFLEGILMFSVICLWFCVLEQQERKRKMTILDTSAIGLEGCKL